MVFVFQRITNYQQLHLRLTNKRLLTKKEKYWVKNRSFKFMQQFWQISVYTLSIKSRWDTPIFSIMICPTDLSSEFALCCYAWRLMYLLLQYQLHIFFVAIPRNKNGLTSFPSFYILLSFNQRTLTGLSNTQNYPTDLFKEGPFLFLLHYCTAKMPVYSTLRAIRMTRK